MRKLFSLTALTLLTTAFAAGTTTVTNGGTTTATSPIVVSATVVNSCTLNTSDITLGSYAATASAPLSGSNTVTVRCNNGARYVFAPLAATVNLTGAGGATPLVSNLSSTLPTTAFTSAGALDTYTVTAAIAPNQYGVSSGTYSGTVNVQIDLLN